MCHGKQTRSAERSSSRAAPQTADRSPHKQAETGNRRRRRRRHVTHTHPLPSGSDGQHGSHHASRCAVCASSSTQPLLVRAELVEGEGSGMSVNEGIRRRHPSPRNGPIGVAMVLGSSMSRTAVSHVSLPASASIAMSTLNWWERFNAANFMEASAERSMTVLGRPPAPCSVMAMTAWSKHPRRCRQWWASTSAVSLPAAGSMRLFRLLAWSTPWASASMDASVTATRRNRLFPSNSLAGHRLLSFVAGFGHCFRCRQAARGPSRVYAAAVAGPRTGAPPRLATHGMSPAGAAAVAAPPRAQEGAVRAATKLPAAGQPAPPTAVAEVAAAGPAVAAAPIPYTV